jgi:septum formation protein
MNRPSSPEPAPSFVWLASQSPRRQTLLDQLGVAWRPLCPDPDEDAEALEQPLPNERPTCYVVRVTLAKAQAARARHQRHQVPQAPIIVADTTVALGGRLLGKPVDAAEACTMLQQLSGRTHRVLTTVAVATENRVVHRSSASTVRFAKLSRNQIDDYIASGEPFGKAGAYAIQGRAAAFIKRIEGSYSGIMGLPLYQTALLLHRVGFPLERSR